MLKRALSEFRFHRWRWLAPLLPIVWTGCREAENSGFLFPKGPIASEDRTLLFITVALMLIVVVPVFILTPLFAWRYRLGNRDAAYRPRWERSLRLELLVWGVPALIVVVLSSIAWKQTHRLDPYRPIPSENAPLQVQVVGLDWKWLFIYPNHGIASANELVIPVDRPVRLAITSDTVMLSFLVPKLAGQIYAMAGMRTELNLLADQRCRLLGGNAHYNGFGFQRQKFSVVVVTAAEFEHWVERARAGDERLDWARYRALAKPSILPKPRHFSGVEPDLFYRIIHKYCPRCAAKIRKKDAHLYRTSATHSTDEQTLP